MSGRLCCEGWLGVRSAPGSWQLLSCAWGCACSSAGAALAALSYFVSAGLGRVSRSVLFSCVLSCCRFHAHTNCPILQSVLAGGRAGRWGSSCVCRFLVPDRVRRAVGVLALLVPGCVVCSNGYVCVRGERVCVLRHFPQQQQLCPVQGLTGCVAVGFLVQVLQEEAWAEFAALV